MELKKNNTVILRIEDMSQDGLGIGKAEGYALFVKDTVIGDLAKVKILKTKKNYGFARLEELLEASDKRTEPKCPLARPCGGCQLQMMKYEEQLRWKEQKVRSDLQRLGGFQEIPMEPIQGMENPFRYRNKAQFPIGYDREGKLVAGFYAGRTHTIIPADDCLLGSESNRRILGRILDWMGRYGIAAYREDTGKGLVRHALIRSGFATGEIMVCLVINGKQFPRGKELTESLTQIPGMTSITFSSNTRRDNVILGDSYEVLWGQDYITDSIGEIRYQISPLSFYQVNPVQTRRLYRQALEYAGLTGKETVYDLYCGIGTISLFLAQRAGKVFGVEIVPQAVEDARANARLNGITNAEFFAGRAEEIVPRQYREQGIRADVVVVDPPRKGCGEELLETMTAMAPEKIVYVSCDPATLARDLKYLCARGYELKKVRAFDQFPQTVHVETVVLLSHKKPDSTISVKVEFGEGEGKVPLDNIAKRAEAYKPKERVTYKMIKEYIETKYGFKVHTAYIAEVKRSLGLPMYDAPNAVEELKQPRKHPTAEKVEAIKDALKHFEVI